MRVQRAQINTNLNHCVTMIIITMMITMTIMITIIRIMFTQKEIKIIRI